MQQVSCMCMYCTMSKFDDRCACLLQLTDTVTLNMKTETATVTVVILTLFGIITFLGLTTAISAVYAKKRKSIIEIRLPNNIDSTR